MKWLILISIVIAIALILLILSYSKSDTNNTFINRKKVKAKWHDGDENNNNNLPKGDEYKLIKLRKGHIKEVFNHNYLNPQQNFHEYGDEEEDRIVGVMQDLGFFTKLIRMQRGITQFFNFGKGGRWVNSINAGAINSNQKQFDEQQAYASWVKNNAKSRSTNSQGLGR